MQLHYMKHRRPVSRAGETEKKMRVADSPWPKSPANSGANSSEFRPANYLGEFLTIPLTVRHSVVHCK